MPVATRVATRGAALLALVALSAAGCERDPAALEPLDFVPGQVVERATPHGAFLLYVPASWSPAADVIVVVHGTPTHADSVVRAAADVILPWLEPADGRGAIVVAPVFDQRDYGSVDPTGAYGGYRGLYGRVIDADEFLHRILDRVRTIATDGDPRFYLYGHSAGGQFAARYVVRHPHRPRAVVIAAAGRYAWPDPDAPWHFGMAPVKLTLEWPGTGTRRAIDITPDPAGWADAATLPVTVVVGDQDTEPQSPVPGQQGSTRIEIGESWTHAMNAFAAANGRTGDVAFVLVTGAGHGFTALAPAALQAMFRGDAP